MIKLTVNQAPAAGIRCSKSQLLDKSMIRSTIIMILGYTCTATYAMHRGVTDLRPQRVATLLRVEARMSLRRFEGEGSSERSLVTSSANDEGDIKRYLNV